MSNKPLISICIPAYKRITDLKILLDSIGDQTFTDYEVIITDDSPDDTVKNFCDTYPHTFKLVYYKNTPQLGTPENWNEGIRKATGVWVKLMHDDDYFSANDSLSMFVAAIERDPDAQVFYSAFIFEDAANSTKKIINCNRFDRFFLSLSPYHMLRRNYFGNPSCIMVKKDVPFLYDNRFKYIVDFAYYIELLQNKIKCRYINKVLIHVGINEGQVTNYTYKNKAVQMYENHVLFEKIGTGALRNVIAFDYYWRIYRNFEIKSVKDIEPFYKGEVAAVLQQMIAFQQKVSPGLLKKGIFSKIAMLCCYCLLRTKNIF
ncbi:MAG: glycosyl transferase family 2 [Ferruginibacter sp.]|uniref:glycosyltransferase family 2 protein n=1 Tax=Ferruginibacter sp. TaxID=1940288 RepID=UPI00265A6E48|nr:glycosyltransferase [Ferruginibacter sp.]MDB5279443.1 glycosyl transferase family 2 [Ferruginibacter sp.]